MFVEIHEQAKRCKFMPPGSNRMDRSIPIPSSRRTCWVHNKMADSSRTRSSRSDPCWAGLGHRGRLSGDKIRCRRASGRNCMILWDSSSCRRAHMICSRCHRSHASRMDHMSHTVHMVHMDHMDHMNHMNHVVRTARKVHNPCQVGVWTGKAFKCILYASLVKNSFWRRFSYSLSSLCK